MAWFANRTGVEPDLQGLEEFIAEKDRQRPLHFAGREAEIAAMDASLDRVKAGRGAGLSHLITAAPGAGKSALLGELGDRWLAKHEAHVAYFESPKIFASPERAMQVFLSQISPKAAKKVGVHTATKGGHAKANLAVPGLGVGGGTQGSRSLRRTMVPARFEEALALVGRKVQSKPVAVLVDEAQVFPESDGATELLLEAHQGGRGALPVLLVMAGLGDTRERLARCGLSKLATDQKPMVLKALSEEEMREVVDAFFKRFRIQGDESRRAEWMEAVTEGTSGWPRHLTNALRGAALALREGEGDLARSSLAAARENAQAFRQQYYYDQMGPFQGMPELISAVLQAMPVETGANAYGLQEAIFSAFREYPNLAEKASEIQKEADGLSAEMAVFAELLHKGLIQEFGGDRYDCPIPSLRRYVEVFCTQRGFAASPGPAESEPDLQP